MDIHTPLLLHPVRKTRPRLWNLHGSYILMIIANACDTVSGLRCGQPGIRIRTGGREFLYSRTSRLTSTHPTSNSKGISFFSEVKRPDREVKHFSVTLRLGIGAGLPPLVLCTFLAWRGKTLPFVATNFPIYIFQDKIK